MSRLVIVVEKASDWGSYYPSDNVVTAMDYLKQPIGGEDEERTQVINLCRTYKYLGVGYYVSLLAEARGHRVIPSVRTINDLRKRSLYGLDIDDLNQKLTKYLPEDGRDTTDFGLLVYFGTTQYAPLADLARQAFEIFPCPILRLEFERQKVWQIDAIKPGTLHALTDPQEDAFANALDAFAKKMWRKPRARRKFRYDIALLHDPNEAMPPSNKKALKCFIDAGKDLGIEVDPIGKNDYPSLAEYDGLFIRETTAVDNHTYRFALRAEKEDMVVIDDPGSILKCTNKIYLADLLKSRKLATPRTEIIYREDSKRLAELPRPAGLPDRAQDPGRLLLARHRQGRGRRVAQARAPRNCSRAPRCCWRRSTSSPSSTGASASSTASRSTPASTSCRAATGRSTTTPPTMAPRARAASRPCRCARRPPTWSSSRCAPPRRSATASTAWT